MAANSKSIVVEQYYNPRYVTEAQDNPATNPEWIYKVVKTVNTIAVHIGQVLTPAALQDQIDIGTSVTVNPVK